MQAFERDRHVAFEVSVRSHVVVEGDEERGQRHDTIEVLEACSWAGMELVCTVEAFDQLFEGAELFTFVIKVLQPDDGALCQQLVVVMLLRLGIVCNDGTVVRGQAVGDDFGIVALGFLWCSIGTVKQGESRLCSTCVGDVVPTDSPTDSVDKQPCVVGDSFYGDIGFVGSARSLRHRHIGIDEVGHLACSRVDVVDDCLVRDRYAIKPPECFGSHASTHGKAYRESQAEADGIEIVVDAVEVNGRLFRACDNEIFGCIVIFAEQVAQFELAGISCFTHVSFLGCECGEVSQIEVTFVVGAFECRTDAIVLPLEHGRAAVRAPIARFALSSATVRWRCLTADLAEHLGRELAIVHVQVTRWSIAMLATALGRRCGRTFSALYHCYALAML